MAKVRWNIAGFQEIRRLPGVDRQLQTVVSSVLDNVGGNYVGGVEAGRTRSRGYVVTKNSAGVVEESREKRLVRALAGEQRG